MSYVPRSVITCSRQIPPPTTTTPPRTTPAPRGVSASPSTISSAAESPSCFSEIGSMISSLVSSIFSSISSLWNYVTCGCTASDAPAEPRPAAPAQPPADVLIAKARNFLETMVYRNVCWTDQAKVAFLMTLNGQLVNGGVATLRENAVAGAPNPFNALCNQGMIRLEQILRQHTLNADSHVQLRIRVLNPARTRTNPTGDRSMTRQGGGSYNVDFSAASDLGYSVHWGNIGGPAAVAEAIFQGIRCDSPEQQLLRANVARFFTDPSATQTG